MNPAEVNKLIDDLVTAVKLKPDSQVVALVAETKAKLGGAKPAPARPVAVPSRVNARIEGEGG